MQTAPLRKLIQVHAELIGLAMRKQLFPRHFALLVSSHAAKHAAQRCFDAGSNLVMRLVAGDAVDEGPFLVAISERQVVREASIRRELAYP